MEVFKVSVDVGGRALEMFVKPGVMATIETGTHKNKAELIPKEKVSIIIGEGKQGPTAWIQVGQFDASKSLTVLHEGWISTGSGTLSSLSSGTATAASLELVTTPTPDMLKCQGEAIFGPLACCTSYGSGCYVTCCGSCCADPHRCPGASCCA